MPRWKGEGRLPSSSAALKCGLRQRGSPSRIASARRDRVARRRGLPRETESSPGTGELALSPITRHRRSSEMPVWASLQGALLLSDIGKGRCGRGLGRQNTEGRGVERWGSFVRRSYRSPGQADDTSPIRCRQLWANRFPTSRGRHPPRRSQQRMLGESGRGGYDRYC
jgi:hypothetical protein